MDSQVHADALIVLFLKVFSLHKLQEHTIQAQMRVLLKKIRTRKKIVSLFQQINHSTSIKHINYSQIWTLDYVIDIVEA